MFNVLIPPPMLESLAKLRREASVAMLGLRFVEDGEIPDHSIDVAIVDDHTDLTGRDLNRLSAILSLSVGVDRLLAADVLPNTRIVRLLIPDHQYLMREYIVYHVLRSHRLFGRTEAQFSARTWDWLPFERPVAGKSVLVLGLGYLGVASAVALRDMGMAVTGLSRSLKQIRGIRSITGDDSLKHIIPTVDFLVCLLPLTPATRGFLNASRLRCLPKQAVFINASRAACVDQPELVRMLSERALAGAVLDVVDEEPLSELSPLWTVPNLMITPHMAAVPPPEAYVPAIIDALQRLVGGRELTNVVDRQRGY